MVFARKFNYNSSNKILTIYHNIISISIDVQYHCVNLFIQWNARAQELNLLCTYWHTDTYI